MTQQSGGRSGSDSDAKQSTSKKGQSSSSGKENTGNFKNDPERAAEAGRKGGEKSHGGGR